MFEEVKEMIDSTIYTNGRGEVTAQNINLAMHGMVDATEEKFDEVEQTVTALGERVEGIAENGTGGSGPLRVWINEVVFEVPLTDGQKAENAATYQELVTNPSKNVILVFEGEDLKGMQTVSMVMTSISETSGVSLFAISFDQENKAIQDVFILNDDGSLIF